MAKRAIYYDTETTGVKSGTDRIVEIAAYDPELDRTFESFVRPGIAIPPDATAIHNITDDMVANASDFSVVGKQFIEFCEGDTVLIAHNNDGFDVHFLRAEYKRHEVEMPQWNFLDTLKWARRYRSDLPRHTLQFLREIYGIESNNAHRALDDVVVLYKVFQAMIDDLPIDEVFDLMGQRQEKPPARMPFGKHQGELLKDVPKKYVSWLSDSGAFDKPDNAPLKLGFINAGVLKEPALAGVT
jgi:DNA polymerase III subunit epsilon